MDDDQTYFRFLTSEFSRVSGIVMAWSAALWFMFWANHSSTGVPPTEMPNWGSGFRGLIVSGVICLFVIIVGYHRLLEERSADRSRVARWFVGLRAILFLIPPVVFTCAFVICATMYFGLIPHQGLGYSVLYTSAVFAWHYFLWLAPDFAEYLFPIQSVIIHTNATTELLAQMCRVAAIITLIGAVVPALGHRKKAEASVVLRRQVPIRFEEPARSWLGGLPQMPDNIPWPRAAIDGLRPEVGSRLLGRLGRLLAGILRQRSQRGAPLHFIAQIACADLPKRVWNGRGPRDGWLLLFVDVLQMEDDSEGGLVQVLHIDRLGPERQPPEDMPTVRHAMSDYIGRFEPMVREGVPKLWRRWPVDLVVQEVPLPPSEDSGMKWEPLQMTGADLYGAPEDDERIDRFADAEPRPLTWRGALYLVDGLRATLAEQAFDGLLTAPSTEPGWLAAKIAKADTAILGYEAEAATSAANLQNPSLSLTPEQRASSEQHIVGQREAAASQRRNLVDLSVFSRPGGEAVLGGEIEQTGAAHLKWRAEQLQVLDSLRARILGKGLEALLGVDDWSVLRADLTASPTEYWSDAAYTPHKVHRNLLDYGHSRLEMALREDVLDLYTRDAAARAVIPPAILAEIEPKLRNIGISRAPHRMGGPRDVVQSYASRDDDDLLFQIFSDDAMGWMWGDLGALFVYLKPVNLKAWRFKRVHAWIDGH